MGTYITQTSIENVFGTSNVARWSAMDGTGTANSTRIGLAIAYAEAEVENRFRGSIYVVPFSGAGVATHIADWCAKLAGVWLYNQRGLSNQANDGDADRYKTLEREVRERMNDYLAGTSRLDLSTYGQARVPFVSGAD